MTKVLFIAIFVSFTLVNALDQFGLDIFIDDTENDVQPLLRVKRSICRDRISSSYCKARVCYCSAKTRFLKFMRRNCAVTCGLCSASCKDNSKTCGGRVKYCRTSRWVKAHCRHTCGLCGTKQLPARRPVRRPRTRPPTRPPTRRPTREPKCMDKSEICGHYNTSSCSSNNWMKANCLLTCGLCTIKPPPKPVKPFQLVEVNIRECLAAHNEKRRKHGAAPLTWDFSLARDAQIWALDQASDIDCIKYSGEIGQGENVVLVIMLFGRANCNMATQHWYDEEKDYNFKHPPTSYNQPTARFAQVVWKNTKRVGVGIVKRFHRYWVVARYSPPGNIGGKYAKNVGNPRGR